jgi:ATP synthase protein I
MRASRHDGTAAGGAIDASGPTRSPWLKILHASLLASGAAALLIIAASGIVAGAAGALSALLGSVLVVLFFAISLLVGHFVGRSNPSGAIGAFIATYVIKVVGFGAALFLLGTPDWLERTWFFVAAVAAVVVWQAAEVFAFSRTRHQLYAEPEPAPEVQQQQPKGESSHGG